eukprot:Opistho-2@51449
MDLENIVANTQYLKAMDGKGRSKKWKEMLRFPHIFQCTELRNKLESGGGLKFDAFNNEPLGKELFREFCQTNAEWRDRIECENMLYSFQLTPPNARLRLGTQLYEKYISAKSAIRVPNITDAEAEAIRVGLDTQGEPKQDLFEPAIAANRVFLRGEPFAAFFDSHYFSRYLQWKFLEQKPVDKDDFRLYRVLGKGGFGEVYACQKRDTGKMYAVKCLDKKRIKKKKGESLAWNERNLLAKVSSPFVVELKYAYETKERLCLVLDLMNGGDLQYHLSMSQTFEEERTRFYAAELVLGLQHLHKANIVYRDMKPENVLLNTKGHIRLSDMGLAIELIPPKKDTRGKVGTPGYMAPELLQAERYGASVDWWGLGCVLYEMIDGQCPFRKKKERIKQEELQERILTATIEYSSSFTPAARSLCEQLLDKDCKTRIGCRAAGVEDIKSHPYFASINWRRLEAGLVNPPFVPNQYTVNARDVLDIDRFDSVKDVKLDDTDVATFQNFAGTMTRPWQEEILETVFKELNEFDPANLPADLRTDIPYVDGSASTRGGFFSRLKQKLGKQKSVENGTISGVPKQNSSLNVATLPKSSSFVAGETVPNKAPLAPRSSADTLSKSAGHGTVKSPSERGIRMERAHTGP